MSEETSKEYEARKKAVLARILGEKDTMDCGDMLHALAGIGWDAALLYDDNGHWAMPDNGHATVSPEPADWQGGYSAKKDNWKTSPRVAILAAIFERAKEGR